MIIQLNFKKISKKSEKFDSQTSKLKPANLSETSRHTAGVHQRVVDCLQSFECFFLSPQPDPSSVMTAD